MSDWFRSTAESERLVAEERVVLDAVELLAEAMERRHISQHGLAGLVKVSPSEVSQRLSGRRNLSLKSLAGMLHALGFGIETRLVDRSVDVSQADRDMNVTVRSYNWPGAGGGPSYTRTGQELRVVASGARHAS